MKKTEMTPGEVLNTFIHFIYNQRIRKDQFLQSNFTSLQTFMWYALANLTWLTCDYGTDQG